MKTKTLPVLLFCIIAQLSVMNKTFSQTSIYDLMIEGSGTVCSPPALAEFYISGMTSGYNDGDTINVYLNFGDGKDTTFECYIQIWGGDSLDGYFQSDSSLYHYYESSGQYTLKMTATGPDNNMDSVIYDNLVTVLESGSSGVNIDYVEISDSMQNVYCSAPQEINFYVGGHTSCYDPGQNISVSLYYGDGIYKTIDVITDQNGYFWSNYDDFIHTYEFPGHYTVMVIATGTDNPDTVIYDNMIIISDTCGNISGTVYLDENSNCILDNGESTLAWVGVTLSSPGYDLYTTTNQDGLYSFNVPVGPDYEITIPNTNGYSFVCPVSGILDVTSVPSEGNDSALNCMGGTDLSGYFSGWGFRPGFTAWACLDIFNNGCIPDNGQIKLVLDSLVSYNIEDSLYDILPDYINGDTLIWNFSGLSNLSWYGICMNLYTSPGAFIDDSVCFTLIIEGDETDVNPSDNMQTFCFRISNSWDPNDKAVSPAGNISKETPLTYTIRFQNTGNAEAYNIFVIDTLDENLDVSTFKLISASHTVKTNILEGNVIKFSFDNIMLPDSSVSKAESNGYIIYTISPDSNISEESQIENTAYIYFDYNPAVVTNTVTNTIEKLQSVKITESGRNDIRLYPNPVVRNLNVDFELKETGSVNIKIVNTMGQILYNNTSDYNQGHNLKTINTGSLSTGVYFVHITTGDGKLFSKSFVK